MIHKEIVAHNRDLLLALEQERYVNNLIKTSQMVDEGKLSSTGGKQVAGEVVNQHKQTVALIERACNLPQENI